MKECTTLSLRLLTLGALLTLPLTGCENKTGEARNEAHKQIETASSRIQNVAHQSAFPTPMTDAQTLSLGELALQVQAGNKPEWMTEEQAAQLAALGDKTYQPLEDATLDLGKIQQSLVSSSDGGSLAEQRAAQAGLRAEVSLGLARLLLEGATRSDARLQQEISLASAHIDGLLELQSIITATGSYDPSSPLRQIDSQAQDARARLAKHQQSASDIQKQITDLQARIGEEVRLTNQLGEQAAKQREAALAAPIDVRIRQIEAAAAVARQADGHQVAAANLESQVDVLQPELARAQAFVLEAEGELKDLDTARARIKAREKEVAADGAQLQSDLRKATEAFDAVFTPLSEQFENELMPQFDAASQAAQGALGDARAAGARGGARVARVQQALGQILWRQSMSLEAFAQLVRRIADNGKALGRSGQDAATADALDARAKEARDGAEAALREALDAIPESGRTDEETASNQQLAALTRQSIEYITGKAVAEVRDLTDLAETVPTVVEPIDTGESPLGLLQSAMAIAESGRLGDLPGLYYAKTPEQEAGLKSMTLVLGAIGRLDTASREKFSAGLVDIVSDPRFADEMKRLTPGGGQTIPIDSKAFSEFGGLKDIDLESIEFSYDNSRTTAWTDTEPSLECQNFVLVDGKWYFEAPEMPEGMAQLTSMFLDPVVASIENIATRTSNGEFADQWIMVSALMDDITKKMQDAMQKMIPPGMDPGGVGRQRDGGGG